MSDLKPGRWAYLKALKPSSGRYVHVSSFANMVPNPNGPAFPAVPVKEKKGVTFRAGDKPRLKFNGQMRPANQKRRKGS